MDREAWRAEIHGVAKSQTRLSDWSDLIWILSIFIPYSQKDMHFVWKSICSDFKRFNSVIMTLKALEVQRRWMNRGWWGFFFPLFIWLRQVLVSTCKLFNLPCGVQLFNCGMRDLVPWPGIEPMNPASGAQILCHWTTWGSPVMRNF